MYFNTLKKQRSWALKSIKAQTFFQENIKEPDPIFHIFLQL